MRREVGYDEISAHSAIGQLWNWLEEQATERARLLNKAQMPHSRSLFMGACGAYGNTKKEMQTLFAGLIDFEEENE